MLTALCLVILALLFLVKPHWIPRILAYVQRNFTTYGAIGTLIDDMEELEHMIQDLSTLSTTAESLPEDLRQRMVKLPGLVRRYWSPPFLSMELLVDVLCSWIVLMKCVQRSPRHEGFDEALRAFGGLSTEIGVGIPSQRNLRYLTNFRVR